MSEDEVIIEASDEEGAEGTAEQKLKKLRDDLKEAQKESSDNLAGWQRAKADYVNLSARMRGMGEELNRNACRMVAEAFIPVADSLEAAAKADQGIAATLRQMDEAFKANGIVRFVPAPGDVFDPTRHESVGVVAAKGAEEDNTLQDAMQSGYEQDGMVIRPARVTVRHYT